MRNLVWRNFGSKQVLAGLFLASHLVSNSAWATTWRDDVKSFVSSCAMVGGTPTLKFMANWGGGRQCVNDPPGNINSQADNVVVCGKCLYGYGFIAYVTLADIVIDGG